MIFRIARSSIVRWQSVALCSFLSAGVGAAADAPPWAFLSCPSGGAPSPAERMESVPGSERQFTNTVITARASAIDWFPGAHAPMPAVVADSAKPGKTACGYCHLPDGSGRPENAKVAGLPKAYISSELEQIHAQERDSAQPGYAPLMSMRASIDGLSPEDIEAAADYFAHSPARSSERVVETARVPAFDAKCFMLVSGQGAAQPLGERIVEMADQADSFELRDPRTTYTAYVPPGSVKRGKALVSHGRGTLAACSSCHGVDLRGGATLAGPPLAGRFTGYLARQLYSFRSGARKGSAAQPMQAVAAQLSDADIIDAVAYAASLKP